MASGTSNERGQYGTRGITGIPAIAIGVGALLLTPVLAIFLGGVAGLAMGGGKARGTTRGA